GGPPPHTSAAAGATPAGSTPGGPSSGTSGARRRSPPRGGSWSGRRGRASGVAPAQPWVLHPIACPRPDREASGRRYDDALDLGHVAVGGPGHLGPAAG